MRTTSAAPLLLLLAIAGCGSARSASPRATLPPDSAALLRVALQHARPAYPTHAEALRANVYAAREPAAAGILGAPTPPPTPPSTPESTRESARPLPVPPAGPHRYGIQIAAFRDEASASLAASDARRHFPDLTTVVESADGWFRVALAGWPDEGGAQAALDTIRLLYSAAWVRALPVP